MLRALYISLIVFLISFCGYGQKRHAINITTNEGLPTTSVRSFHKDSRGYLWIGTDAGVVKFDGLEMTVYNHASGLPGEKIWDIDEDWNGNMWFACFGEGIARFDGMNITTITKKDGLPDNAIRKFVCHWPSKTYLFGTGFTCGFFNEDFKIRQLEDYYHPDSLRNTYTEILLDSTSAIYLCHSNKEYAKLFFDTESMTPVKNNWMKNYNTSSGYIRNNNDTIITNERTGIVIKTDSLLYEIGGMGQVFGMAEDGQNRLWIAAWNDNKADGGAGGLFSYDNGKVLSGNAIFDIQTSLGWVINNDTLQSHTLFGTLNKGIYTFPLPYFTLFEDTYFGEKELEPSLLKCAANGNIFFTNYNKLIVFNSNNTIKINSEILLYLRYQHICKKYHGLERRSKLLHLNYFLTYVNQIFTGLDITSTENILFNAHRIGCFQTTSLVDTIITTPYLGKYFSLDENDSITQCGPWDERVTKMGHYKNINPNPSTIKIRDRYIQAKKHFTYQNETWLCSRISGVFIEKDCAIRDLNEEDSTINHLVNAICFDSIGTAYIGGNDGRIEVLNPVERKKVFEIAHKKTVPAVLWMHIWRGHLFAGHADGLRVYNLANIENGDYSFRFLGESEGNVYRNVNNSDIDSEGNMWLATTDGVVKVDANLILDTKYYPLKTVIDKVELFNKETDWSQYGEIDRWSKLPKKVIELPYDENNLSIYYHTQLCKLGGRSVLLPTGRNR